jgi:hypothetical protein
MKGDQIARSGIFARGEVTGRTPMMIFLCSECNQKITGGDDEPEDRIFDRLERHVTRCPMATFTFDGLTEKARQRADALRAVLKHQRLAGKIQLH